MVVFKICQGDAYLEGWSEGVTYKSSYEGKQQQWQLLKSVLPRSLPLKDLAAASLSDLTARRQLTLHLLEAGNSSEVVAETLKLLYGTAQPKGDPNIDLSVAERHELVLLKLIKMNMPVETTRATMALLYEPDPRTKIESEQTTAAQDECSTECGEQFVTVEHISADHADLDAIPVNSPLFMISSSGSTLNTSETGSAFVKLNESEDGLITIQSANDESKCLILNEYLQCVFGSADVALKFKMRLSKAGRLVLMERLSGCALETEIQGRQSLVVCRNSYSPQSQSWLLFTTHTLVSSLTTSNLQKTEYSPDARRQLIMGLAVTRRLSIDIGEVLALMYGSRVPTSTPNPTNEIRAERAQQILELLARKVPMEYVGAFLEMMYRTSALL